MYKTITPSTAKPLQILLKLVPANHKASGKIIEVENQKQKGQNEYLLSSQTHPPILIPVGHFKADFIIFTFTPIS